jgi:hypothetical protein
MTRTEPTASDHEVGDSDIKEEKVRDRNEGSSFNTEIRIL